MLNDSCQYWSQKWTGCHWLLIVNLNFNAWLLSRYFCIYVCVFEYLCICVFVYLSICVFVYLWSRWCFSSGAAFNAWLLPQIDQRRSGTPHIITTLSPIKMVVRMRMLMMVVVMMVMMRMLMMVVVMMMVVMVKALPAPVTDTMEILYASCSILSLLTAMKGSI